MAKVRHLIACETLVDADFALAERNGFADVASDGASRGGQKLSEAAATKAGGGICGRVPA
ncbi:predicted protein [Pyrenophora tritici-repentis Pt-1C-BFP]|uniref:Uncharacterized protein n=1 Tax=Pyrenophora tritici-repentis (strain Pt-1C-BFP) TaxID=426418 RepID=B2WDJ3_PYRTR|nr:uncharacterized protein PTRG_08052 [Pyrenophora tritici-repentis Pt-1C-BFP]EDU50971.1 predicted protein [Pyrenophora tritici-repentis Pt-1C-BFP]